MYPEFVRIEMEVFAVKILVSLVLMTSSVVAERLSTENKNGNKGHTLCTKNNTKEDYGQEGTGTRRCAVYTLDDPYQQCYTQFFVGEEAPVGLRTGAANLRNIRYICQPPTPNQQVQHTYYATMLDERTGDAVFSAYRLIDKVFFSGSGDETQSKWCPTPGIERQGSADLYENQFPYEKGHLAPAKTFSQNPLRYVSTYTYTNAVPQCESFNTGLWKRAENRIRVYAQYYCTKGNPPGTLYLLTGTSFSRFDPKNFPEANHADIVLLNAPGQAIWIPVSMWTAGCCVHHDNLYTRSFAVIGNNLQKPKNAKEDKVSLTQRVSVRELQDFLRNDAIANQFTNGGPNPAPDVLLFPGNQNCLFDVNFDIMDLPTPKNKKK